MCRSLDKTLLANNRRCGPECGISRRIEKSRPDSSPVHSVPSANGRDRHNVSSPGGESLRELASYPTICSAPSGRHGGQCQNYLIAALQDRETSQHSRSVRQFVIREPHTRL